MRGHGVRDAGAGYGSEELGGGTGAVGREGTGCGTGAAGREGTGCETGAAGGSGARERRNGECEDGGETHSVAGPTIWRSRSPHLVSQVRFFAEDRRRKSLL